MGKFFLTGDTHFGHQLITDLRGFASTAEHDEAILTAWNERVARGDVVFHHGDFMLPYDEERATKLLRKLHGTKMLIRGNHDPSKLENHSQWAWTGQFRARKVDGWHVVMCHYALRSWPGMGRGVMHTYGHSHGNLEPDYGKSMDVGVDTRPDYAPWDLEEVVEVLGHKDVLIVDHHDREEGDYGEIKEVAG